MICSRSELLEIIKRTIEQATPEEKRQLREALCGSRCQRPHSDFRASVGRYGSCLPEETSSLSRWSSARRKVDLDAPQSLGVRIQSRGWREGFEEIGRAGHPELYSAFA